jgi:hypothetical protein
VADVVADAAAATDGGRIFFVLLEDSPLGREATGALPPGFERVETRTWPGIDRVVLDVYERR